MTLREKLIVLRDKAGISQMTLAHQLGVSRQAVSRWESGDATPSMDKLKALAKIYGVSLDWLCSDASDAGALVQEKNLDERDPVCNSELPTEDKPKKRKKWAIIIGVIIVGGTYWCHSVDNNSYSCSRSVLCYGYVSLGTIKSG